MSKRIGLMLAAMAIAAGATLGTHWAATADQDTTRRENTRRGNGVTLNEDIQHREDLALEREAKHGRGVTRSESTSRPELELIVDGQARVGRTVLVRVRNNGRRIFVYRTSYAACDLSYRDARGRKFIVPPGTHCDIMNYEKIAPGQTVTLFSWRLDECIVDQWGCVQAAPLAPGTYTIEGSFYLRGRDGPVPVPHLVESAEAAAVTFEIS